jgi:hypothetical protein
MKLVITIHFFMFIKHQEPLDKQKKYNVTNKYNIIKKLNYIKLIELKYLK